jgi:serine/threonine protein kinase
MKHSWSALDLLGKMLAFDPSDRITVPEALEHPWLAAYHDESDEPVCPEPFRKWQAIEELETLEDFREALWNEIADYRREVRGVRPETSTVQIQSQTECSPEIECQDEPRDIHQAGGEADGETALAVDGAVHEEEREKPCVQYSASPERLINQSSNAAVHDPVVTYARRSSIMQPSRQGSTYNSPLPSTQHLPAHAEGSKHPEPGNLGPGTIVFPGQGYIVPARSRTGSMAGGGEYTRKLLRTLSTVSIHESVEGLAGGLAGIAPIGKFIVDDKTEDADAPPSEMPREFGINETLEVEDGLE